jgi:hypothetical protein
MEAKRPAEFSECHADDSPSADLLRYVIFTVRSIRSRCKIYIPLNSVKEAPANVSNVGTSRHITKPHMV